MSLASRSSGQGYPPRLNSDAADTAAGHRNAMAVPHFRSEPSDNMVNMAMALLNAPATRQERKQV